MLSLSNCARHLQLGLLLHVVAAAAVILGPVVVVVVVVDFDRDS